MKNINDKNKCAGENDMRCYSFDGGLRPLSETPENAAENLRVIMSPVEAKDAAFFGNTRPPVISPHDSQLCWQKNEPNAILGQVRTPARANRTTVRFTFAWTQSRIVAVDYDGALYGLVEQLAESHARFSGSADGFFVDLLMALVEDDLMYIQQLETRVMNLEQAVLSNDTARFIDHMSVLRRELHRNNRYYAQLSEFAMSLQENDGGCVSGHSVKRLGYFLRKISALREETQMLREYASQVSGEYQAQVDIAQNRIMKLLTIVTTVFLPLSLIVGWYGMNFSNMPELDWAYGYPAVIVMSIMVVLGCIAFFKRRHFW